VRTFDAYDQATYQSGGTVVVRSVGTGGADCGRAGTLTAAGTFGVQRLTIRLR